MRLFDLKSGWTVASSEAFFEAPSGSKDVVIDDLIPCDKHGTPLFAQLEGDSSLSIQEPGFRGRTCEVEVSGCGPSLTWEP